MDTRFDFKTEEPKIYAEWENAGHFQPVNDQTRPAFSIVLPPPNANADLHLGHAMYVIEDIMVRYHRMKGDATLWLPGADHAGFETQFVFEKNLAKQGKSRFDYESREKLFSDIWDFVQKNRVTMENQLRALGFSLDWTRKKFTLDEDIQKIVYKTFKKMYDDGLIYRGERLVNYCTKDGTSFSDLEVIHEEIEGKLYFIRYEIVGDDLRVVPHADKPGGLSLQKYITVATTRPETMFGDVAIAVNPKDKRYEKLIGLKVKIPFTEKEIPIIGDEHAKQDFGTGAVKITPSHDTNDFEVGKRHNLKGIQMINFFGKLNENCPAQFQKLSVLIAREKILEELKKLDLLEKIENHKMVVSKCYKCNRVLEPLPLPQWFVKIKPLVAPAIDAIEKGEIKIYPESKKGFAVTWLNNFYDWNISRQVVWGMRIPAWKCKQCEQNNPVIASEAKHHLVHGEAKQSSNKIATSPSAPRNDKNEWIITDGEKPSECPKCKSTDLIQDTDSFDTWFSSSQWPFATLKGQTINTDNHGDAKASDSHGLKSVKSDPRKSNGLIRENPNLNQTDDYSRFYPTSVMETGYDILPIWVCRMIFMGIYVTGKIPFKNVYLHGLVRDAKGQKMSKSKGNVINPLEMVDKYGADALRASLLFGIGQGADVPFSEDKVRAMRNFVTKIWNIGRFLIPQLGEKYEDLPSYNSEMGISNPDDKQILSELEGLIRNTSVSLENYDFSRGLNLIYDFLWHEFADIYIEKIKPRINNNETIPLSISRYVFLNCLKLLHPFMPFVTEALWNLMPKKYNKMLIVSKWPETEKRK